MPVQSWGHSHYWTTLSTVVVPPPSPPTILAAYPLWQRSNIVGALLGPLFAWWDAWYDWGVSWVRFCRRVARLTSPQQRTLLRTLSLLESPHYPVARRAIRETATTLGFNEPEAWRPDWRRVKDCRPLQENLMRHTHAYFQLRDQQPSSRCNADLHYLVELAYQEYAIQPWRTV